MTPGKEELERGFVCPKCRARDARVNEVTVGRAVARVIPLPPNSYFAVTCGLCGYTEFYDRAIALKNASPAAAPIRPGLAEKME